MYSLLKGCSNIFSNASEYMFFVVFVLEVYILEDSLYYPYGVPLLTSLDECLLTC